MDDPEVYCTLMSLSCGRWCVLLLDTGHACKALLDSIVYSQQLLDLYNHNMELAGQVIDKLAELQHHYHWLALGFLLIFELDALREAELHSLLFYDRLIDGTRNIMLVKTRPNLRTLITRVWETLATLDTLKAFDLEPDAVSRVNMLAKLLQTQRRIIKPISICIGMELEHCPSSESDDSDDSDESDESDESGTAGPTGQGA